MIIRWIVGLLGRLALAPVRRSGGLILCFHEIDANKFTQWMSFIERFFELVSLDELVRRRESGESIAGSLAITHDDGWKDTCTALGSICEERNWPVTIYLPTALLQGTDRFWFSELPDLVEDAAGQRLSSGNFVLDLSDDAARRETHQRLCASLSAMPGKEAADVIEALREAGNLGARHPKQSRFVDPSFVKRYAASQWVSFGSHSVDHQSLASQSEDSIREQLSQSKALLEATVGYPVTHFCYPYGDRAAIGHDAPAIVGEHYRSATTMNRGSCNAASDLTYLPRIPLYEKDTLPRVVVKLALARWF